MSTANAQQAWSDAQKQGQRLYAIVELGQLLDQARLRLLGSNLPKQPLMAQPEFAAMRDHGPWLLEVSSLEFDEFLLLEELADSTALMGWICTDCSAETLAEHLSDALLATDESGNVYLLRSYTPNILPLLYARAETPWHAWLFGPMNNWWLLGPKTGWQCIAGLGLDGPADYQPIILDAELWQALELDPLACSLTNELEKTASQVFLSTCHGDRLNQVKRAIDAGRHEGLQQADDLTLFATLQLFDRHFPANHPNWAQVLTQVQEQQQPLARVLKRLSA